MSTSFEGLGIAPRLLAALTELKFTQPTPIQSKAIPEALAGKDVIGIAQTGTGKTLSFSVPIIQLLAGNKGMAVVLVPTRELALQADETLRRVGQRFGLKTAVIIGGASMDRQHSMIRAKPHVIIATPGRLNDHLQKRTIDLATTKILVLDEADRMFDMGFAPQIKVIIAKIPHQRQTLLFSATMPSSIAQLARQYMKLPIEIEVAPAGTAAKLITQHLYIVRGPDKNTLLEHLLKEYPGSCLVFVRTKFGAKRLTSTLMADGVKAAEIHSNRSLSQRQAALAGFKSGRYRVLVATDIAARGIDVTGIALVVNYDLPDNSEDYVHRIGRTGRAERSGHAVSFATPDQASEIQSIERLIRNPLPLKTVPEHIPAATLIPGSSSTRSFGGRGRGGRGGSRSGGSRRPFRRGGSSSSSHRRSSGGSSGFSQHRRSY